MSVVSPDIASLLNAMSLNNKTEKNPEADNMMVSSIQSNPALLKELTATLAAMVNSTAKGSEDATVKALSVFTTLAREAIQYSEPYLAHHLPTLLVAAAHKNAKVRSAAETAVQTFASKMSSNSLMAVAPHLFKCAEVGTAWQTRVLALKTLASFGDHCPEQLGNALPEVIPQVSASMGETKREVAQAANEAMVASCDVIGNRDIEHMTPHIIRSITNPEEVTEIMHNLAGVTFVQSVQAPALAFVVPLLIRGLRSKLTATRRQSAVIIDNMSKLVDDPLDAEPFLPTLLPALAFAADAMSDPEARKVAENASNQLNRLARTCEHTRHLSKVQMLDKVKEALAAKVVVNPEMDIAYTHAATLCLSLMSLRKFDPADWDDVSRCLATACGVTYADSVVKDMVTECREIAKVVEIEDVDEADDAAEELCNCTFTLAYGTKILLHNTNMRLKKGHKYGLLGGNDSGKTTLMRSIANGSVEGFPDPSTVRTVFVEADILGELSHLSCVDYILQDPRLSGCSRDEVLSVLSTVGFSQDSKANPYNGVSTLSGGWRMKLALARAMLQKADILLLDEPTNHLDVINVAWVKNYINSLKQVTAIMVSHDSGFLNDCCTDILQIERLKLKHFSGNLNKFIALHPEAKALFSLKEAKLRFKFPQPGPIEGVKSRSKALMKMSHCYFTYPGNSTPTLHDISIQVSMASRVGCVGENGAGKSTMIKLLTGELEPQVGDVWKHPNARVAYVAQHAFHHIEQHLNKTPNEYIRWRYANGEDKESLVKVSMILTEQEQALQREPFEVTWKGEDDKPMKAMKVVVELTGLRRENKQKEYEYEVKYRDGSEGYLSVKVLARRGWEKACKAMDARLAQRSGLAIRTLSSANVEQHLADCGLEAEFSTHYRMQALSGGQKVKVVMAAAMWNQPHILILDEPTNYLDRESLGALANAIADFQGGVVIISHNNEFVSTLCPEEWVMDSGHLTTRGEVGWMNRQDDKISDVIIDQTVTDALGNTTEIKAKKKALTKRDEKAALKAIKKKIDAGEELDEDEEELATKHSMI